MAKAILSLLHNPGRAAISQAAQRWARAHTSTWTAQQFENIYRERGIEFSPLIFSTYQRSQRMMSLSGHQRIERSEHQPQPIVVSTGKTDTVPTIPLAYLFASILPLNMFAIHAISLVTMSARLDARKHLVSQSRGHLLETGK